MLYYEHAFAFEGWDANKLWHSGATYTATANVYNVQVNISMTFVPKYVSGQWQFASYVPADTGLYVFAGQDFVLYSGTPAQQGLARYNPVAGSLVQYTKSKSGAYVYYGGSYVPYDATNDYHNGLDRYTYDLVVAEPTVYEQDDDGDYVYVDGKHIAYDATKHAGQTRYRAAGTTHVVYRTGTDGIKRLVLDPNKVDYLSAEAYPQCVVVTFTDGTKAVLSAVWDLSILAGVSPDEDYTETVPLYIGMNQKLDDVYMRIESTRPQYAYYRVQLDAEGQPELDEDGFYVSGDSEIELTLLTADAFGNLVVHDLNSQQELHALICGCADPDCKGYLYFDYGDSTTSNSRFAITAWKNLNLIGDTLRAEAAKSGAKPLAEISFNVDVIAVARNIEHTIKVHVKASNMSDVTYPAAGMPLIASSLSSGGAVVYSMQAEGTALTVDPYVADIKNANNYPKQLQFNLGDKVCTAYVDSWDLSALASVTPYQGANATVYAQLATPFGNVRVAAPIVVKTRTVQAVYMDGSDNRIIYVNAMSAQPFGTDVVVENGRTIALRTVQVKFAGDDLLYTMTMRYDITDLVATGYGTELAQSVSIWVGNAAGGYQTLDNYRIFTVGNDIMKIQVPTGDPAYAALKAYLQPDGEWDGYIYNGTFVTFDDSAAANEAWRTLTTINRSLVLYCGYQDEHDVLHTSPYAAAWGTPDAVGIGYTWQRATVAGQQAMRLEVWNTVALANDHVNATQYVSTGTDRYIALSRAMLSMVGVADATLDVTYSQGYTVGQLLADHTLSVVGQMLQLSQLSSNLYAAEDTLCATPLTADTLLAVGTYTWRVAVVASAHYRGYVDITVTVAPMVLNRVDVYVAGVWLEETDLQSGYTFHVGQGFLNAITAADHQSDVRIDVRIFDGEMQQLSGLPAQLGTYTVQLVAADANCRIDLVDGHDYFTLILAE